MQRRQFILGGSVVATSMLAGCSTNPDGWTDRDFSTNPLSDGESSESNPPASSSTGDGDDGADVAAQRPTANPAGKTVTHDQIAVSVDGLLAAEEYQLDVEDSEVYPPTAGGYWMFANVSVEHVGSERRPFPNPERVTLPYEDDADGRQYFREQDFEVRGEAYQNYHATLLEKQIYERGAFPGVTIDGWLVFEVPRQYQLDEFLVTIRWGTEEGGVTTERWKFAEDDIQRNPKRDYSG